MYFCDIFCNYIIQQIINQMSQEIIIEMEKKYPFEQIQYYSPDMKVFVRKIVKYNKDNYKKFKEKFQIAKKLSNINIIKLVKILQQDGRFHLLYEYVPYKLYHLKNKSKDFFENLKAKLIFLTSFIFCSKIQTKFDLVDLGLDKKYELKYYLDIDFQIIDSDEELIQSRYLNEVNKLTQNLSTYFNEDYDYYSKNSGKRTNAFYSQDALNQRKKLKSGEELSFKKSNWNIPKSYTPSQQFIYRKREKSHTNTINREDKSRQKSIISVKSSNTLQILNSIQQKIDILRLNMKKNSSKSRISPQKDASKTQANNNNNMINDKPLNNSRIISQFDDDKQFGESVRQKPKKQKVDHRKYSGEVGQFSPFLKKTLNYAKIAQTVKSVRTQKVQSSNEILEKINETSQQYNNRKQSLDNVNLQNQKSSDPLTLIKIPETIKRSSSKEFNEPLNKQDFQVLKKNQFQNFFNSKQKYVHQFLDILDDEKSTKINGSSQESKIPTTPTTSIRFFQQSSQQNEFKTYQNQDNLFQNTNTKTSPKFNRKRDSDQATFTPKSMSNIIKQSKFIEKQESINKTPPNLNQQLKCRISQAIQKSDQALQKYRKLSTHSISTQFGKNKK